jgi:periplasmic copper chaperone A
MTGKHNRVPKQVVLALGFAVLMLSSSLSAQNAGVIARDAWARLPLKSKMDTALYMVVENHNAQSKVIVGVTTDDAASAEMHQMTMTKMIMVMTPVTHISIPAKGQTSFDPNNFHIMLFGLKTRPAVGDKLHVTLKLDDGTTVPVEAVVKK